MKPLLPPGPTASQKNTAGKKPPMVPANTMPSLTTVPRNGRYVKVSQKLSRPPEKLAKKLIALRTSLFYLLSCYTLTKILEFIPCLPGAKKPGSSVPELPGIRTARTIPNRQFIPETIRVY